MVHIHDIVERQAKTWLSEQFIISTADEVLKLLIEKQIPAGSIMAVLDKVKESVNNSLRDAVFGEILVKVKTLNNTNIDVDPVAIVTEMERLMGFENQENQENPPA